MAEPRTREERFAYGMQWLSRIDGDAGAMVIDSLADLAPELAHQIVAWGFGDIYSSPSQGCAPVNGSWSRSGS